MTSSIKPMSENRPAPGPDLADSTSAPTQPAPIQPATVPQPAVHISRGRASLYMFTSVLMFLTQGLGMNLLNANLYQLQGAFSATVNELAWLSATYMAPYASLSVALLLDHLGYADEARRVEKAVADDLLDRDGATLSTGEIGKRILDRL